MKNGFLVSCQRFPFCSFQNGHKGYWWSRRFNLWLVHIQWYARIRISYKHTGTRINTQNISWDLNHFSSLLTKELMHLRLWNFSFWKRVVSRLNLSVSPITALERKHFSFNSLESFHKRHYFLLFFLFSLHYCHEHKIWGGGWGTGDNRNKKMKS